jgi:hypothetical protein
MISWRHRNEDADHWKNFIDRQIFLFCIFILLRIAREKFVGRQKSVRRIYQRTMMDHCKRLTRPVDVIPAGDTTCGAISRNFFELLSN